MATSPSRGADTPDPVGERSWLVLVVDDNEKNLRLARDVLHSAGFETLEATRGSEALELAAERVPDVILMDLRLPDLDGAEVTRMLCRDPRTAGIPVVALSALPLDADSGWLGEAGFAGWLEKPLDVRSFPEQVHAYCSGGRE